MKVLVVDDDRKLARFVARVLTEEGYAVDHCDRGADAVTQAQTGIYDVIVLDWMLPDIDGLSVVRDLRRAGMVTPVLMLTARGDVKERVLGLSAGADDYLPKPFEVDELVWRVKALVRRSTGFGVLHCAELEIDRLDHRVTLAGHPLELTNREYGLLLQLARHPDQVVTRSELLTRAFGAGFDPGSNLVEVHMSRLRDKLGDHSWMIETVRGAGYRLRGVRSP